MADEQQASGRPLVSVVVPVRNGLPWVEHQLRALAAQRMAVDWEVVVADNGSGDGTRSCVERWSERYPHIRMVDASSASRSGGGPQHRGRVGPRPPTRLL